MVGRAVANEHLVSTAAPGVVLFQARGLQSSKDHDVSFSVRAGQILVVVQPVNIRSPSDAIAAGIGLIPEDGKRQGAMLNQSINFNSVFLALFCVSPGIVANARAERAARPGCAISCRSRRPAGPSLQAGCRGAISKRSCWRNGR